MRIRSALKGNVSLAGHPHSSGTLQSDEITPGLSEFDLNYYGWRVVLAACLGVHGLCEAAGRGIRLEPRSRVERLRYRRRHSGPVLPAAGPLD